MRLIVPHVRLIHSVASESALRELARHRELARPGLRILIEVNIAGEQGKAESRRRSSTLHRALPGARRGADDHMPPLSPEAEDSRRWFAALRELAGDRGPERPSMGTSQDYVVAVEEGATLRANRHQSLFSHRHRAGNNPHRQAGKPARRANTHLHHGFPRLLAQRALVYFGLAEEYHDDYER